MTGHGEQIEETILQRLKTLSENVSLKYCEIGKLLKVVRDGELYRDFGHPTFESFSEEVLHYKAYKSRWLIRLFEVTDRWKITAEERDGIAPTRLLLIAPVMTLATKAEWLSKAKVLPMAVLRHDVTRARGFNVEDSVRVGFTVMVTHEERATIESALELGMKLCATHSRGTALCAMAAEALSSWHPLIEAEKELTT